MRVHWQRAPGWAQPKGLRSKGWTQLADGGVEIPLWSNGKGVIGAFRYKQREGGVLGRDRLWYTCSETGPKLKLLVEDLRSAERVEALAEAEVDQLLEDVLPECDDGELDKAWAASVEEVYSVALDEQLERDEKMLKDACVAEIFEDIGKLQKQCRKFARKKLGKKKETWLDPPGEDSERARCLWLGNYPELIEEISGLLGEDRLEVQPQRRRDELREALREHRHRALAPEPLAHLGRVEAGGGAHVRRQR